jgi:hypothetical protein
MADKPSRGQDKSQNIAVSVTLPDDDRARKAELAAYAFSPGGKLLDLKPIKDGDVTLRVPVGAEAANVRIVVGPRLDAKQATVQEITRRGGVERHMRVAGAGDLKVAFPIDIGTILCWLRGRCLVRGTVLKQTTVGGQPVELPVCDATVEIYEVDPFPIIIAKLPQDILDRLRDVILNPIPLPDPPPDPLDGPFPGPFGPDPGPGDPVFMPNTLASLRFAQTAGASARSHRDAATALASNRSGDALRLSAMTASDLQFKQALVAHEVLVRPIFCALYWRFFTMQLVATTTTDDCGHFRTTFFNGCKNPDKPDLYFKVKQHWFFGQIVIYAPTPVPCYTYWNYTCGSEVTLITHHPLARTCPPCPPVVAGDNWVLFVAMGATSMNAIFGDSPALQSTTTATNKGLTGDGRPFGGVLRPQLLFDNSLRDSLGVKYYKLSWRRGSAGSWNQMLDDVVRHYTYDVGGQPVSALYKLGPLSPPDAPAANLFEIPPSLPPQGVWGPVIAPTDYQNGLFNTTLPAPGITYDADGNEVGSDASGKFEIMLELFDTAGNGVNIGALGIKYFVPNVTDLTGTITTTDASTLGLVVGNTMIVTVHVDNNPTYAEIDAPTIGASSADPCCGVLEFVQGDTVTLPWRAKHKNGFATFTFTTKRVDQVVISIPSTPVGLGGNQQTTESAQTLMDTNLPAGCQAGGCSTAAFASLEYVTALATDGWTRLSYLDSADFEAFTLKKK